MSGVLDLAGPVGARDSAPSGVAFPTSKQGRHPDFQIFRGSIPRLHVPLSTLRVQPHDCPRMTRGRCGPLGLHRTALASAPPRRFIPAHVAVGTPVAQRPPHGSGRALISASGSYRRVGVEAQMGYERSYPVVLLRAHSAARLTRSPSFASGTRLSAPCSPWSVVFPPCPPPVKDFHLCSGTSQVLHNRPTPYQRSCRDCGSSPSSTGPPTPSCRALVGPPGSRAWRFHACRGS